MNLEYQKVSAKSQWKISTCKPSKQMYSKFHFWYITSKFKCLWGKQLSSLLHLEIQEHIIEESETRRFCPKKLKKLVGPVELL